MYGPPGFKTNVGAWIKPSAKATASPSRLSMLTGVHNLYEKILEISSLEISKLETLDISLKMFNL